MKRIILVVCVNLIAITSSAFAKEPPTSAEQLRTQVETALRAKDTNAFTALFNWQGVSPSNKALLIDLNSDIYSHDIAAVKLAGLPVDFEPTNELNGVRSRPNVVVVGMIDVEFKGNGATEGQDSESLPYGTKDGAFYLAGTIEDKTAMPATAAKSINILVMGSAMPDAGTFSGSYVYLKNGQEVKEAISGKGNLSEAFWGDYLKSCTVQKDSDSQDWIQLIISEGGQEIFKSEKVATKSPIVWERTNTNGLPTTVKPHLGP
jgi:hypothetical protein